VVALLDGVAFSQVDDELVLDPEAPHSARWKNVAWLTGTFVSSSACTISTGVRTFEANEIGLSRSCRCGPIRRRLGFAEACR
jgi:hypothetical protein